MNAFMAFLYMMTIICKDEKNQAHAQGMRHHWLAGARCLSAASRRLSDRAGSSTARASSRLPTMVDKVTSARSWAAGCPQSGDWRAMRSTHSLLGGREG